MADQKQAEIAERLEQAAQRNRNRAEHEMEDDRLRLIVNECGGWVSSFRERQSRG